MRWIGRLLLLVLAVAAILLSAFNTDPVVLRILPEDSPLGPLPTVEAPVFAVVLAALFVGIVVGIVLEWLRSMGRRRRADRIRGDGV